MAKVLKSFGRGTDYKSGALPTELSRQLIETPGSAWVSPMAGQSVGQAGSEQSGKIGHTPEPIGHNPGHTAFSRRSSPNTSASGVVG